ncbi:hypothetical protein ACFIOY_35075 [Bradyrhizobium sp. TZ2]
MASSAIARSLFALVSAASAGYYFGWQIGITAEAVSTSLAGVLFLFYLRTMIRIDAETNAATLTLDDRFVATDRDGFLLFVAFTLALVPVSFDRMWVVYFSPGTPAAQYAFSGIFVSSAITVTSIYIQKLGPELVRDRALGRKRILLKHAVVHAFAVAAILVAGTSATFVVIYQLFYDVYWSRFSLSPTMAVLIVFASAIQVGPIFDWSLIALDGEKGVLFSSIVLVLVTALLFVWSTVSGGGVEGYLLSLAAGRAAQILTASFWINRLQVSR